MSFCRSANLVIACFIPLACIGAFAQAPNCDQISAMARMARAKSSPALAAEKTRAGDSYRSRVVFAARLLELRPHSQIAAVRLLELIPRDDEQQTVWMTLGDGLCKDEPVADMKSLGRLSEGLPRLLAQAVLLAPERLPSYVAYAAVSVEDPHSDYAVQMQTVCRIKHAEFKTAVKKLPAEKKRWFLEHIFNPQGCRALALPEAD